MPERIIEDYLADVLGAARLTPARRAQIADELRDHVEEHAANLQGHGLPREQALRHALQALGAAEDLASGFSQLHQLQRRRMIMRCSYAGLALSLAGLFVVGLVWPEPRLLPVGNVALADEEEELVSEEGETAEPDDDGLETKLDHRVELKLVGTPLEDALQHLARQAKVDILINRAKLDEVGVDPAVEVTLHLQYTRPTLRTALELLLEQHGLSYTTRDNLIIVTSAGDAENVNQIEVYNVADLLRADDPSPAGTPLTAEEEVSGIQQAAMTAMAGLMNQAVQPAQQAPPCRNATLAGVIQTTISPDSWSSVGGPGAITQYKGLLIVKNAPPVHARIRKLLQMMREAS